MKQDHRKFLRFEAPLDARLRVHGERSPAPTPIHDVSKEGLRLTAKQVLPQGTEVKLEIILPGELVPLFAEARVRWCQPAREAWRREHDTGLEITRMDPFDRSRLLDFAYEKWLHTHIR
ncbi:MAG: PilZ domain-containing protein [Candidatus Omnitrophica bacterium]|nr:PilZ domain-containing protein [Candidatus Omnitrophota bacterium]